MTFDPKTQQPTRVVINEEGEAVPAWMAERDYNIKPDVVFVRDDGWTLGAPKHLAQVAKGLWEGEWVEEVWLEGFGR